MLFENNKESNLITFIFYVKQINQVFIKVN